MIAGKIAHYKGNGRAAALDSETMLWAARMLVGEGWKNGKGAAVLWCTMYRFLGMPHKWPSYLYMIRRFSQPINERWLPGGDLYERAAKSNNAERQKAVSKERVARRRRIQNLEWSEIPEGAKQLVAKFALGDLPAPAEFAGLKYSNFASYANVEKKHPGGIRIGGDYFFVEPTLQDFNIEIQRNVGTPIRVDSEKKNELLEQEISACFSSPDSHSGTTYDLNSNERNFFRSYFYAFTKNSKKDVATIRALFKSLVDDSALWQDIEREIKDANGL